jgi:hypothetical protein
MQSRCWFTQTKSFCYISVVRDKNNSGDRIFIKSEKKNKRMYSIVSFLFSVIFQTALHRMKYILRSELFL